MVGRRVTKRTESITSYRYFASAGEKVSVRMDRLALERIADAVMVAEQFGRETAGFLAGRIAPASDERERVTVDAFLPITGECLTADFFDYDDIANRVRIERQVRALGSEHALVGFVRSSMREGGLTVADRLLMDTHLGGAGIFLLVENPGNLCGTLYTAEEEGFASARASYTFVFNPQRESAELRTIPEPAPARTRWAVNPAIPTKPAAGGNLWKSAAVAAMSAIGVLAIALLAYEFRSVDLTGRRAEYRENGSAVLPVGLNAERTAGNQWRISWNRESTAIRNADKARLTIQDGPLSKEVQLNEADLRIGSIVFSPFTDDVRLKLEIFDAARGRTVSEGIRVLGPVYGAASEVMGERSANTFDRLLGGESSLAKGLNLANQNRQSGLAESKRESQEPNQSQARRAFTPSESGLVTVSRTVNDLPEPPDVKTASLNPPPVAAVGALKTPPQPLPPAPEKPRATVAPSAAETASGAPSRSSRLEPAKILNRVDPVYPRAPFLQPTPMTVHIEATIGEDGRIHDAKAVSGPLAFQKAALDAVRQWVYSPAKLSDRAIAVPTRIEIRFR
jgi:TonB family protein